MTCIALLLAYSWPIAEAGILTSIYPYVSFGSVDETVVLTSLVIKW